MVRQVRLIERGNTPEQTRELTITQPEYLIGRGPDCDLRLPATEVSRHHCIIRLMAGEASVIDLGSVNGTFLNGQRVRSQATMYNGDRLQVGEYAFLLQLGDQDPRSNPPDLATGQTVKLRDAGVQKRNHPPGEAGGQGG